MTSVALVAVLLSFSRLARARRDAEPAPLATAVLPFRATGLSGDLSFLPSGIVDLLSVSMASRDSLAVVDPEVVHRWWDARAASGTITGADSLRRAAISLGVRQVVTGTLVGNARQLVIRATLMEGRTGRELAAAAVNGSLDSLPRLVDRLATLLVATAAGAGEVARLSLDADPHALRAYLRGRDAYRRADFSAAQSYFANALALDSSLAASSVGLALASDWLDDPRSRAEALDAALRWRARLPIVEQQQIAAMRGVRYPEPSSAADYFAGWERVARTGERPELWAELGRRLLADGRLAGVPDADARASEAFARALAIDSADAGTRVALVALAATHDSMAVPAGDVPNDTDPDRWFSAKWRRAAQASDGRAVERARQGIGAASDEALRRFALTALSDGEWLADGERALRERGARARSTGTRVDAALAEHAYALNAGSPARALQATRRLGDLVSDGAHLRLRVLDALYADGDSAAALDALQRLTAHVHELPQASSTERSVMLSDLCVVEQWRLWHGDYSTVSVTIRALTVDAAAGPVDAAVASGHATCAYVVDAIAAGLQGSARAPDALARAEQLAMTGVSAGDMGQYATLALARVRDKRGELARALSLVRRRAVVRGWPRYLTSYLRLEASVAERLQDTVGATDALRHYLALRPAPDSSGMAEVEGARRKLRRLLAGQ